MCFDPVLHSFRPVARFILIVLLFSPQALYAAEFTVDDNDPATLAAAINDANASADPVNTINITATSEIVLTAPLPHLDPQPGSKLIIQGPGASQLAIDGDSKHRVFFVNSGDITMRNLTIKNGYAKGGDGGAGGGIFVNTGVLTLEDVSFEKNGAKGGSGGDRVNNFTTSGGGGGGFEENGATTTKGDGADGGGAMGGAGGIIGDKNGKAGGEFSGGGGAALDGGGGHGGFGGGGGAAGYANGGRRGGNGGFGGGGGSGIGAGNGGKRGLGGGNGGACSCSFGVGGGGGAGLGGAVFVRSGALLVLNYSKADAPEIIESGGSAIKGVGLFGQATQDGQSAGSFVFLHGENQELAISVEENLSRTITGTIAGEDSLLGGTEPITLKKLGKGNLVIDEGASIGATTEVDAGILTLNGTITKPVIISDAALEGAGTAQEGIALSGASKLSSVTKSGILTTTDLTLSVNTAYYVTLGGAVRGDDYNSITATEAINLGSARLEVTLDFIPTLGQRFTIIDGSQPITGTFAGLAEGSRFLVGPAAVFEISYVGGDGHDVVLTVVDLWSLIGVSGNGMPITFTPNAADNTLFPRIAVKGPPVEHVFTVTNSGLAVLNFTNSPSVVINGPATGDYTVTKAPTSIPPGGSADIRIAFSPQALGTRAAEVYLPNTSKIFNEFSFPIEGTGLLDTDSDGIPDETDPDDDNDGVSDVDELLDGSDPLDPESVPERATGRLCADYNGFLSDFAQVLETRNIGSNNLELAATLIDSSGEKQGVFRYSLAPEFQRDLIVNEFDGFNSEDYGSLCVDVSGGIDAEIDGNLMFYRLEKESFSTGFSSSLHSAKSGRQYFTFNSYFPTRNAAQLSNAVAGFIQIANEEASTEGGRLVFYDREGDEINRLSISLRPFARTDIDVHALEGDKTGLVAWVPDDLTKKFRLAQNRYYFAGKSFSDPLQTANSIAAQAASGERRGHAFSTENRLAVLELSNTLSSESELAISIYDEEGVLATEKPLSIKIPALGTTHLVLNDYLENRLGNVALSGKQKGSLVANLMEYAFDSLSGDLLFATTSRPRSGYGRALFGSYNNFLGGCTLRLANLSTQDQKAALTMRRYDGTELITNRMLEVPANGAVEFDVCADEPEIGYGSVMVEPENPGHLVGEIRRLSSDGSRELSSPLHE